jgi:N-acetyl-anhydromuramyl-L-alanine amidase AmpD
MSQNKRVDFQPLSVGEQGTMIYVVQKLLNQMGYGLEEDGIFSEEMEGIVKSFQETRETLKVDGVVDYETLKEIDELSKQD